MKVDIGSELSQSDFGQFVSVPNIDITVVEVLNPTPFTTDGRLDFVKEQDLGLGHAPDSTTNMPEYLVCGYPTSRAKPLWGNSAKLRAEPFGFRTRMIPETDRADFPYDPQLHHFFKYRKDLLVDGKTGHRRNPPPLEGISGSGVWHHRETSLSLVGIMIAQYPAANPKALVVVRIDAITEAIRLTLDLEVSQSPFLLAQVVRQ
ncbi:MAG: hypothetical protein KA175_03570 [Flavobacteriales bacterium]|nr:hypothetical protein [Flavobacteriales bacterium]